jgi:tetratricopeptide (TPR) repeat protein
VIGVAAALVTAGCAVRQSGTYGSGNRFLKNGKPKTEYPATVEAAGADKDKKGREQELAKARELALRSGPPLRNPSPTLEATDPDLTNALRDLGRGPASATRHLAVGDAYRRHGVLDKALEHYLAAQKLDRRSAAAYDGSARIWRDAAHLDRALADASRAAYFAPQSPEVLNTLGTILLAAGNVAAAQAAFTKALAINPAAEYARHNANLAAGRVNVGPTFRSGKDGREPGGTK